MIDPILLILAPSVAVFGWVAFDMRRLAPGHRATEAPVVRAEPVLTARPRLEPADAPAPALALVAREAA